MMFFSNPVNHYLAIGKQISDEIKVFFLWIFPFAGKSWKRRGRRRSKTSRREFLREVDSLIRPI